MHSHLFMPNYILGSSALTLQGFHPSSVHSRETALISLSICSPGQRWVHPEAKFFDLIGTKVLRVFLPAIHSHLY